jgi:putative Mg2+ transporter-C (MgtC) family protein
MGQKSNYRNRKNLMFEHVQIDWWQILRHLQHLILSYVLAFPIGFDREFSSKHFGMRTFPLVAVVSCGFMLTGMSVIDSTDGEARVFQGIITGIGFIGGGAILRRGDGVEGTATAASIWNTGAIGVAVAFNRFEIALVLSLLNFITLRLIGRLKKRIKGSDSE